MNLDFKHLLPANFPPQSRVWIYQSSRLFSISEALRIEDSINDFCASWQSHGTKVKGHGALFFGQFVMLMADEAASGGVSGCSTDSSVNFIKGLGLQLNVDFFNRTNLAFYIKDKIQILPLSQLAYAAENNFISGYTLYFNNVVMNKKELEESWIIPVKNSWLGAKLKARV
ncbi:MAG TPA: hypothetical protein VEY06_04225 [Flavisolibacter sp.]|nr:hypothetical protein [Flavisolibacter sp.]